MYMTSVLWSDQNDIIVYRTFKDFKTLNVSYIINYNSNSLI
jgi:hypothetical protein